MPDGRVEAQPLEISEEMSFNPEDNLLRFLRARVQVSTSSSSPVAQAVEYWTRGDYRRVLREILEQIHRAVAVGVEQP